MAWATIPLAMQAIHLDAAAQSAPSSTEREVLAITTNEWDADCDGDYIPTFRLECKAWYNDMQKSSLGSDAWKGDGFYFGGDIVDSRFADPGEVSWGNDDDEGNLDEADAALIGLHGGHGGSGYYYAKMRVDEVCSDDDACNCASTHKHWLLGDKDLEFLHLNSCHSMCRSNFNMDSDGGAEWIAAIGEVHQIDGFHGICWMGVTGTRWGSFAVDGFYSSIAESWIDHLYRNGVFHPAQCPVVFGTGRSTSNVEERTRNERYDYVYPDQESTHFLAIYKGDCDPESEGALPGSSGDIVFEYESPKSGGWK
jgi:hypothetical protein